MEGKIPDKVAAKYIVSRLSGKNYIPPNSVSDYEYAILKIYEEYFEVKEKNKSWDASNKK